MSDADSDGGGYTPMGDSEYRQAAGEPSSQGSAGAGGVGQEEEDEPYELTAEQRLYQMQFAESDDDDFDPALYAQLFDT